MRPLFVGKLTEAETDVARQGLQSSSAFTVRRCQILLKSAAGQKAGEIAEQLHCSDQTVRVAIHAFHREGLACLEEKSHARHDQRPNLTEAGCERLKELIRLSPRILGYETSVWTRPLLADVLHQEGYSAHTVSPTNITMALKRAGISWRRAKQWIRSPDPHYEHRKKDEIS
jgi:transposase